MDATDSTTGGQALQDVLRVHCFGCGALNEHGLRIKSRWDGVECANAEVVAVKVIAKS